MPGSHDRGRAPWQDWTREQWQTYRDQQAAACERPGWEKWAEMTGRILVKMADRHLKQLEDSAPCSTPSTTTKPSDTSTPPAEPATA